MAMNSFSKMKLEKICSTWLILSFGNILDIYLSFIITLIRREFNEIVITNLVRDKYTI